MDAAKHPSRLTIHVDGAARGNPGPGAFAYVITGDGQSTIEESGPLGTTTNNVAEYTALIRALERATKLGVERLAVYSDSELLVKQMNGEYRVKDATLKRLYRQAKELCDEFESVSLAHVPRAQNARADQLCNEALDRAKGGPANRPSSQGQPASRLKSGRAAAAQEEAVECLRTAATAWARGNPEHPPAEDVWEQIWTILEDRGVVR